MVEYVHETKDLFTYDALAMLVDGKMGGENLRGREREKMKGGHGM